MKKMNDKGFSLVELIIVIAIMAILLVVLAPQYLRYVERSRNSTDLQNATEIVTALQILAADPQATNTPVTNNTGIVIPANGGAAPTLDAFAAEALGNAGLLDGSGDLTTTCQSRTAWTTYTITWTVGTDGNITFGYTPADFATAMGQ